MAICFFRDKFEDKYPCTYEIKDGTVELRVEYDVCDEIPAENGFRIFSANTEFKDRDIILADEESRRFFLLKNAYYNGEYIHWGIVNTSITVFKAQEYFEHSAFDEICKLRENPKVTAIRIFSKNLIKLQGVRSYYEENSDEEHRIILKKNSEARDLCIETSKISAISVNDNWRHIQDVKNGRNTIEIDSYTEIRLKSGLVTAKYSSICMSLRYTRNFTQKVISKLIKSA